DPRARRWSGFPTAPRHPVARCRRSRPSSSCPRLRSWWRWWPARRRLPPTSPSALQRRRRQRSPSSPRPAAPPGAMVATWCRAAHQLPEIRVSVLPFSFALLLDRVRRADVSRVGGRRLRGTAPLVRIWDGMRLQNQLPEVSLGDVLQEGEVLDRQRPVQSQHGCVLLSGGEIAGIVVAREHEADRVPRHDAENREDDHGHSEEDDRRLAQTLEYES